MATTTTPSINQLKRAVTIAEQIQNLEAQLTSILENSSPTSSPNNAAAPAKRGRKRRGKLSPEGLARIKAAQQERWNRIRGVTSSTAAAASTDKSTKPKNGRRTGRRTVSPEARLKMAEAAKKRWAKKKAKA